MNAVICGGSCCCKRFTTHGFTVTSAAGRDSVDEELLSVVWTTGIGFNAVG